MEYTKEVIDKANEMAKDMGRNYISKAMLETAKEKFCDACGKEKETPHDFGGKICKECYLEVGRELK